jgi:glycosyltransferase involved in cell wall biosynthesis
MTERRRKIAVFAPFPIVPTDDGGRVRMYHMIKELAKRYDVLLLTPSLRGAKLDLPVRVYECFPTGQRHQLLSAGGLWRAWRILRHERPDVLLAEFIWHGVHCAVLSRLLGVPFVVDSHNVESARFRDTGRPWRWVRAWEWITMRLAQRVLVVSDEDRDALVRLGMHASKIEVIPNGVDPALMHRDDSARSSTRAALGVGEETQLLLFFGQLDYAPNRHALEIIERELLPRWSADTDYLLAIAGKGASRPVDSPRVRMLGGVPDIAPYVNAADFVVVPVTSGGGTRLKILESIACGAPVVSTSAGAEGIDRAICGPLLDVTGDWDEFARLAMERRHGAREAPSGFLDRYAWHNIVSRLQL